MSPSTPIPDFLIFFAGVDTRCQFPLPSLCCSIENKQRNSHISLNNSSIYLNLTNLTGILIIYYRFINAHEIAVTGAWT
jgi:hypothetical protein